MKQIQILGTGCPKCKKLAENAETATKGLQDFLPELTGRSPSITAKRTAVTAGCMIPCTSATPPR
jgi:hypothetical protein